GRKPGDTQVFSRPLTHRVRRPNLPMGHGAEPPDLGVRRPAVQACPRAVTACQKGTPRMRSAAASRTSRSTRCALTRKGPSLHEGSMRTIDILSPVALGPAQAKALAPRLPTLRGKVLGIRVDRAWRSFHVYADELGRLARERPHPMGSRPEAEVRALARQRFDELIGLIAEEV